MDFAKISSQMRLLIDDLPPKEVVKGKAALFQPKKETARRFDNHSFNICPYCGDRMSSAKAQGRPIFLCEKDRYAAPVPLEENSPESKLGEGLNVSE